jgi:hypothetical protein
MSDIGFCSSAADFVNARISLIPLGWVELLRGPGNDSAWNEDVKKYSKMKSGILKIGKIQRETR